MSREEVAPLSIRASYSRPLIALWQRFRSCTGASGLSVCSGSYSAVGTNRPGCGNAAFAVCSPYASGHEATAGSGGRPIARAGGPGGGLGTALHLSTPAVGIYVYATFHLSCSQHWAIGHAIGRLVLFREHVHPGPGLSICTGACSRALALGYSRGVVPISGAWARGRTSRLYNYRLSSLQCALIGPRDLPPPKPNS